MHEDMCPICLEPVPLSAADRIVLACKHAFCMACLVRWTTVCTDRTVRAENCCPTCRAPIIHSIGKVQKNEAT